MIEIGSEILILHEKDRKKIVGADINDLVGFNLPSIRFALDFDLVIYLSEKIVIIVRSKYDLESVGMVSDINFDRSFYSKLMRIFYMIKNQGLTVIEALEQKENII